MEEKRVYSQVMKDPVGASWALGDLAVVPSFSDAETTMAHYKVTAASEDCFGPEIYKNVSKEVAALLRPVAVKSSINMTGPFQWQGQNK